MDISQQQLYRSLYAEHIAEIGFNLSDRQTILQTDTQSWQDCVELEQYIAAHLSALRLGGQEAYQVLLELLESVDEDEVLGAVFSLVSIDEFSPGMIAVIEAFQIVDEDILPNYIDALKHGLRNTLSQQLLPLLEIETPLIRAATVEILGYRGDIDPKRLWPLLHETNELVQTSVMIALMRLGYRQARPVVEELLLRKAEIKDEMLLLLLVLGSPNAQTYIRNSCQNADTVSEQRLIFLALFGGTQDFSILINALSFPEMKTAVYESLGILGDVQSIPFLITGLNGIADNETIAAATALNYLTGANLTQTVTVPIVDVPDLEPDSIIQYQAFTPVPSQNDDQQHEIEMELPCVD
ncbi:MAG: hypothetical protein OEZ58_07705 [Gammaproteobacteria bacterium]|nr:hypothetical protein [Gammaproteobacteria bacterium]MDH5728861.1 hypothetical protein [Gammaproteobacteria bacterium]